MSMIARGLLTVLLILAGVGAAFAQQEELAPLAAWVAKSKQKATIDGKVALALGLNTTGAPMQFTAVTTPYLDGARTVHLVPGPPAVRILFSQGKARHGQWYLTWDVGALLRVVEWVPTSANPQPGTRATALPAFRETKAFWKAQLGTPVR